MVPGGSATPGGAVAGAGGKAVPPVVASIDPASPRMAVVCPDPSGAGVAAIRGVPGVARVAVRVTSGRGVRVALAVGTDVGTGVSVAATARIALAVGNGVATTVAVEPRLALRAKTTNPTLASTSTSAVPKASIAPGGIKPSRARRTRGSRLVARTAAPLHPPTTAASTTYQAYAAAVPTLLSAGHVRWPTIIVLVERRKIDSTAVLISRPGGYACFTSRSRGFILVRAWRPHAGWHPVSARR